MPELAEVEYVRKRWNPGLGQVVSGVRLHPGARVFRTCDANQIARRLAGARLLSSEAAAKQMLFRLSAPNEESLWLGVHLGMTGDLRVQPAGLAAKKADHLILDQTSFGQSLVFSDPRMFGCVQFHAGQSAPGWWTDIAPAIRSEAFTAEAVAAFFQRRARTPVKTALLMQERFPGIGNWMADEILWRAGLHPARRCGDLSSAEIRRLHREAVWVAAQALLLIGASSAPEWPDPPDNWLFRHRWADGGRCPRTGCRLERAEIGGRTTCWSPARQRP